ncbi:ActS/PrrB/RegB family redox-sensitive histidine kinase [Phenylobacterium sp.]|uniref:ActS/PrrB/RegB family redox-sensitive histidine kinase n=1 Tax=Phenylobacterium sp. TaxID=1871053 RepID=UPI0028A0EC06|nr:ActS/PrrB/RegB family redox-sensitive histidine kinase [Phenylobacterium sp.]
MAGWGVEGWNLAGTRGGRLRMRTLVTLRWMIIAGELLVFALGGLLLGFDAPYTLCFTVIGASAWVNLLTGVASPGQRLIGGWEAVAQLGFDIGQISLLLFLTGGAANPFILMLLAPVTLGAATLAPRSVNLLAGLAIAASVLLAFVHAPLPGLNGVYAELPMAFMIGCAIANIAGIIVIAGTVRQAAEESSRMALAFDVTQAVLAREQRLSALGALAAAAAHELGTPLATISIVSKELAREAPTASVKEDADLLIAQAERCGEILRRLTDAPAAASDEVHERMSLLQLVHEVIEPQADVKGVRVEAIVSGAPGVAAPDIWRMPEVLHAMTSFVENAIDFAESEVLVTVRFDAENVGVEVRDDGPGFPPEVLSKLGEPYVTSRPGVAGGRTGHVGMGLGFFIAKTLLERTGATVNFQNGRPRGAIVAARWPRARIEVKAPSA